MWPLAVDWQALRFGVEIEFVAGDPAGLELLPGWTMALDEQQIDETGSTSGSELRSPPIRWHEREQIREMLARLLAQGAQANWSCGLHVHVGLDPWGQSAVVPLLDAALSSQAALQSLLQTAPDRLIYCPDVTPDMKRRFLIAPTRSSLVHQGRPQSHRCGINTATWFDIGTVEIRYANGSLDYAAVVATVVLCLRFVAAVGAGHALPAGATALATALGAPVDGYPPPLAAPRWYREQVWLEDALIPVLAPLTTDSVPDGEVLHVRPTAGGIMVVVEDPENRLTNFVFRATPSGWELLQISRP